MAKAGDLSAKMTRTTMPGPARDHLGPHFGAEPAIAHVRKQTSDEYWISMT